MRSTARSSTDSLSHFSPYRFSSTTRRSSSLERARRSVATIWLALWNKLALSSSISLDIFSIRSSALRRSPRSLATSDCADRADSACGAGEGGEEAYAGGGRGGGGGWPGTVEERDENKKALMRCAGDGEPCRCCSAAAGGGGWGKVAERGVSPGPGPGDDGGRRRRTSASYTRNLFSII